MASIMIEAVALRQRPCRRDRAGKLRDRVRHVILARGHGEIAKRHQRGFCRGEQQRHSLFNSERRPRGADACDLIRVDDLEFFDRDVAALAAPLVVEFAETKITVKEYSIVACVTAL